MEVLMKAAMVIAVCLVLGGCGLNVVHKQTSEAPTGGYQTHHHTVGITYDTEPACNGSCK